MTHPDLAKSLLALITTTNLQIPAIKAREFVELTDWLSAIADGHLSVVPGIPRPSVLEPQSLQAQSTDSLGELPHTDAQQSAYSGNGLAET